MNTLTEAFVTIALAVVGLAMVSAIVSRNANSAGVVQAISSGLGNNIATAISPVTGANVSPDLSYPGGGSFGSSFGSPNW
jgi:hypothetical protein